MKRGIYYNAVDNRFILLKGNPHYGNNLTGVTSKFPLLLVYKSGMRFINRNKLKENLSNFEWIGKL